MSKLLVKLLRPLNNQEVGSEVVYDEADAKRLEGYGSVGILGPAPEEKAEGAAPANKAEGASKKTKAKGAAPARKAAAGQKAKAK